MPVAEMMLIPAGILLACSVAFAVSNVAADRSRHRWLLMTEVLGIIGGVVAMGSVATMVVHLSTAAPLTRTDVGDGVAVIFMCSMGALLAVGILRAAGSWGRFRGGSDQMRGR